MREPWEWIQEDLQGLIDNKLTESLTLEYKACPSLDRTDGKKKELSKDVSSFANAMGGTIVYGIIEGNGTEKNLPVALDNGYDPQEVSRECLESVINSTIHPRIDGIRINPVLLASGNAIYVVSIPQSGRGHMASDNRYYKRYNFQSIPMEDYEVRDVMNRSVAPDLTLKIWFNGYQIAPGSSLLVPRQSPDGDSVPIDIQVAVLNDSNTIAEYAVFQFVFAEGITVLSRPGDVGISRKIVLLDTKANQLLHSTGTSITFNHGIPGKMPLWKGVEWTITNGNLKIRVATEKSCVFGYRILAPLMPQKSTVYNLTYDGGNLRVANHLGFSVP